MSNPPTQAARATDGPRLIEVDAESDGQRLDNFLFSRLKGVPKSCVYRILRTGELRVNGGRCKAGRRLEAGDKVRVPPLRLAEREAPAAAPPRVQATLEQSILFEDEDFLVLDKPSGIAVHGGSGVSFGVIETLRQSRPNAKFLELVHRLDRETSGCLLIAKKRSALTALHEMFRDEHQVGKVYTALLAGVWARKSLTVDVPLRKNVLASGERVVKVARDGKPAMTIFRRLRKFAAATLVEAELKTGRTHQIRVHAQHLGHPIVGDERYGLEAANRALAPVGLRRLFLHAACVSFKHPRTGKPCRFVAPLPADLAEILDRLAQAGTSNPSTEPFHD